MDTREKLIELQYECDEKCENRECWECSYMGIESCLKRMIADHLIANGVTVQESCHKAESVISQTGLMCTACLSDIDRDAVFCKYCGAKVMPQPPKGE